MKFFLVVQACTILLPLIAFARCGLPVLRKRSDACAPEPAVLTTGLTHMVASITMMFVMHGAYKYANGWLSNVSRHIYTMPELTLLRFGHPSLSHLTPAIRVSVS